MHKKILSSHQLREITKETVNEVADVVSQTLGPAGNPIIIQKDGAEMDGTPKRPHITKDGISVAEAISFSDPQKETINRALREASANTVESAGDGTTSTMVLLRSIFNEGYKLVQQGNNGIRLFQELKSLSKSILEEIDKHTLKADTSEKIRQVALISCNGDEEIADTVTKAVLSVGEDGYIKLEESYGEATELRIVDGAEYLKGYSSFGAQGPMFINDDATRTALLQEPAVLCYAGKLDSVADLRTFLQKVMGEDFSNMINLFIVANDYSDDVREFILTLRANLRMNIAAVKGIMDGSPNHRTEIMKDFCVMTGGTLMHRGVLDLKDAEPDHLGLAERVDVKAKSTVMYIHRENDVEEDIEKRIQDLKTSISEAESPFDADNIRLRIAKLSGGLGIISVGGQSDAEMKERKDRVEDALCSARAAIKDGLVPGGGFTLYQISKTLNEDSMASRIMKNALQAPIRKIIENTGENADVVLSHLPELKGYDALNKVPADMLEMGIVDAALVVRNSVKNSVSVAGMLLTSGGAIVNEPTEAGAPNPMAMMQQMFGGMG